MRIYLMTDLEGVAGVQNFQSWTSPGQPFYLLARQLLTQEVNAAVHGFFAGGASGVVVADGHGAGAVDIADLDPRVEYMRGWPQGWPLGLEEGGYDAVAVVGQHARARTPLSNMAHTQSCEYLELSINGMAIGEFGQLVMCASELGIPAIFAAGEKAFAAEAQALLPGIQTVWVKRGTRLGRGDECTAEQYEQRNGSAIHLHPERARELIRVGAEEAVRRARQESFGILPLHKPFRQVMVLRAKESKPQRYAITEHPESVAALMNLRGEQRPVESPEHLRQLLVD
ncbi:MAG: M55 family metallopeptidase [Candidatus Latescibacterota bacterium]